MWISINGCLKLQMAIFCAEVLPPSLSLIATPRGMLTTLFVEASREWLWHWQNTPEGQQGSEIGSDLSLFPSRALCAATLPTHANNSLMRIEQ